MLTADQNARKEGLSAHKTPLAQRPYAPLKLAGWAYTLLRVGIGALFVISGAAKLAAPEQFTFIIDAYGLIPDALVSPAALVLSGLELLAGIGMILGVRGAQIIITALLLLFMMVLGYGIWLGLDVDCGCFAAGDPEGGAYHGLRPA
ncbi:MAG: MauE/DoxX family redox-associated membrane protein, partial [Desulfobacteraceae bacterium]